MKRNEVEDKLADYAFGTMSINERATFEAELASYPDLQAEYHDTWEPLITSLPLGVEQVSPPSAMRVRVLSTAFKEEPLSLAPRASAAGSTEMARAATPAEEESHRVQRLNTAPPPEAGLSWWRKIVVLFTRPQLAMPLMAAMLIVTLVSTAWGFSSNVQLNNERAHVAEEQQELDALLSDHNVHTVAMRSTDYWKNGYATAIYDPNKTTVYISLQGPLPKVTMDCQVWATKQGQTISLGTFRMASETTGYLLYAPEAIKNYDGLIVSWEKPGGAKQPTNDWIVVQSTVEN